MQQCLRCQGFLPGRGGCPNCTATPAAAGPSAWVRTAIAVASGASLSITLSACYGAPVYEPTSRDPNARHDLAGDLEGHATDAGAEDEAEAPGDHHHDGAGRRVAGRPEGLAPDDPDAAPCPCEGAAPGADGAAG